MPHPSIIAEAEAAASQNPDSLVTLIDLEGVFYYISPNSIRITGYNPAEAIGRPFMEFVDLSDIEHLMLAVQDAMLNERSVDVSMRARHKSGGYVAMRGHSWKLIDPTDDKVYILAKAEPTGR